jgi:hypothetical protein
MTTVAMVDREVELAMKNRFFSLNELITVGINSPGFVALQPLKRNPSGTSP